MSYAHRSSTATQSGSRRPLRTVALAAASLSLATGGIALAGAPAQAAQSATYDSCTVTAERPRAVGVSASGKTLVHYGIHVDCKKGGRTVHLQQKLMEADDGWGNDDDTQRNWSPPDESTASGKGTPLKFPTAGKKDAWSTYRLVDTDAGPREEPYHVVKFMVVGDGDLPPKEITVTSPYKSIHPN